MPEITQRVFVRMVTEVEVSDGPRSFDNYYTTTEELHIPAGTTFHFGSYSEDGGSKRTVEMIFEQDLEIVQAPPEEETDGTAAAED